MIFDRDRWFAQLPETRAEIDRWLTVHDIRPSEVVELDIDETECAVTAFHQHDGHRHLEGLCNRYFLTHSTDDVCLERYTIPVLEPFPDLT